MFEDLNWRSAARRAGVVVLIYIALFYALSAIFPESFALESRDQVIALLINAVFFFFVFTVVYAFVERSRNRRLAQMRERQRAQRGEKEQRESGPLKGRPNPNTARKKARRRR